MSFYKRVLTTIIVGVMAFSVIVISTSAYGSDNDIPYSFNVSANQGWGYTSEEHRGPSNTSVPWKVNFTYSSEGAGTYMQYFLIAPGWSKQSDYKNTKQGSGNKYYHAYDTAYNVDVALGARNNNYESYNYNISGYWDEETAKHAFSD